ncbi:Undecaprenyl-phosphate galactosephosphotransferase [Clostridium tyrobutyricum DIVETGP]|uniref:Undecaprenyl-phosphate galactosephosphotransferase n=1 Tax=Clostridium tyrobutyricum DIVETGP TaxID=1408889 RepID=W6N697_CLOTY|nr:sugar transferase [Clostridium tyrobutyricum]CDL92173.1 Undecaprenyl-phosphate galactosephosphotransferase [Clostridium tyrobutyricum DIVETGP]
MEKRSWNMGGTILTETQDRELKNDEQYIQPKNIELEDGTLGIGAYGLGKYKKSIFYHFIKRSIDISCSILGITLLSPVMIAVAVAIKLDSKGSAVFSQQRVGLNGKLFKMYKFRSMVVNAEDILDKLTDRNEMSGPMFKMKEDPRITRIGKLIRKTSLDELPQLFNVIKGDMSLVGPRPNLPREVVKFNEYQKHKLLVKPGLTCYWQVMGRNEIGFEEWMRLDIKYIKERSTLLDIKLIFKTFGAFFEDDGAR